MKNVMIVFLLILTACSSHRVQDEIPPFSKETVCSTKAQLYLKKNQSSKEKKNYSEKDIHARMLSLEPDVRRCYEEEIDRTNKKQSFNLCLVVGYTRKGEMEFFEFSTKEIKMSSEFESCLFELKSKKELDGFKYLSIVQPFRLQPKY